MDQMLLNAMSLKMVKVWFYVEWKISSGSGREVKGLASVVSKAWVSAACSVGI